MKLLFWKGLIKGSIWLLLLCAISSQVRAQVTYSEETTQQIWVTYIGDYRINEKWHLYGDGSYRWFRQDAEQWSRWVIRPSARYKLSNTIQFSGGFGIFYTYFNDEVLNDAFEFRPWQGIRIRWPRIGKQYSTTSISRSMMGRWSLPPTTARTFKR